MDYYTRQLFESTRNAIPGYTNSKGTEMEQVVSSQTSNIVPEGFANLLPPQRFPDLAPSLLLRSEFRFTLHQNVQRTYSICHGPLSRSVQRSFDRFVTEIAPKSWLLCQIRSPIGYGFGTGVRAIT